MTGIADFQDVISKLPRDWLHTISVRRHAMATCNECRLRDLTMNECTLNIRDIQSYKFVA